MSAFATTGLFQEVVFRSRASKRSNCSGCCLARAMTVIETAKLNGLDPQAYLADILARIHDHKINRLDELLPWNWAPMAAPQIKAA